jgi:hypothetical protein
MVTLSFEVEDQAEDQVEAPAAKAAFLLEGVAVSSATPLEMVACPGACLEAILVYGQEAAEAKEEAAVVAGQPELA